MSFDYRTYNRLRYHKRMNTLRELLGGKCIKCNSKTKLEIHHKNPKTKSFTLSLYFSKPWKELLKELKKCELLCWSCHKIKHKAVHGLGMYTHHKCRCDICRKKWNQVNKRYKEKARLKAALV